MSWYIFNLVIVVLILILFVFSGISTGILNKWNSRQGIVVTQKDYKLISEIITWNSTIGFAITSILGLGIYKMKKNYDKEQVSGELIYPSTGQQPRYAQANLNQ